MTPGFPPIHRRQRQLALRLVVLSLAAIAGVATGVVGSPLSFHGTSAPEVIRFPVAYAVSCGQNLACTGGDLTVTSAIDVDHRMDPGALTDDPVQLDDSEDWTVTGYWYTKAGIGGCACQFEHSDSVTVAVTHSGTSWMANCTGCDAMNGPIFGVTVCDINTDNCSSYDSDYRLVFDVAINNGFGTSIQCAGVQRFLNRVEYSVTSIDDGNSFETTHCTLGSAVSPTQNTFTATDNGAFGCAYNCSETGPALTVTFQ